MIGQKVWKYRIVRFLGSGGFGKVYEAVDERDGSEVALKLLPESVDPDLVLRFKRETSALLGIVHPHIVRVRDVGIDGDAPYYVMDLIRGTTLRELMEQRASRGDSFPSPEIVRLALAVASALDAIHHAGLVHRDIKPSNIMVDPQGRPTLMDFGLVKSRDLAHMTQSGQIIGTPLFMSPEQLRAEDADARSDLYQLGLVMYAMATMRVPFGDDQPFAAAHRRLTEPIPPPSRANPLIGAGLEHVVMRLLALAPRDRYPTAADLLSDLQRLQAGGDVTVTLPADSRATAPPRPETSHEVGGAGPARPAPGPPPREGRGTVPPPPVEVAAAVVLQDLPGARLPPVALLASLCANLVLALALLYLWWNAASPLTVRLGPREVQSRPGALAIRFRTDRPVASEVLYGSADDLSQARIVSELPVRNHEILIEGLPRGRQVSFAVRIAHAGRFAVARTDNVRIP